MYGTEPSANFQSANLERIHEFDTRIAALSAERSTSIKGLNNKDLANYIRELNNKDLARAQ